MQPDVADIISEIVGFCCHADPDNGAEFIAGYIHGKGLPVVVYSETIEIIGSFEA